MLQQEQEAQLLQAAFNASLERIVGAMPGSEHNLNICIMVHVNIDMDIALGQLCASLSNDVLAKRTAAT
jgi:hypothetical protein